MNDFILVRHKAIEGRHPVEVYKKSSKPDLREYKLVRVRDNGMEEYVHQDEYEVYKKIFEKKNDE